MSPESTWTIYSLHDPRTGQIRYIGRTIAPPKRRLINHVAEARHDTSQWHTPKCQWIRELLALGLRPILRVLEAGTGDGWATAEILWIKAAREAGVLLVNTSDGGEGNLGYSPTPETRRKLSEAGKGRKLSPENRAKLIAAGAAANRGRKWSPERIEQRSAKLRGIPRPPHVWEKCRAAANARIMSDEQKARLSALHTGLKASAETRAKMSASGLKHSEERRAQALAQPRAAGKFARRINVWERGEAA